MLYRYIAVTDGVTVEFVKRILTLKTFDTASLFKPRATVGTSSKTSAAEYVAPCHTAHTPGVFSLE